MLYGYNSLSLAAMYILGLSIIKSYLYETGFFVFLQYGRCLCEIFLFKRLDESISLFSPSLDIRISQFISKHSVLRPPHPSNAATFFKSLDLKTLPC